MHMHSNTVPLLLSLLVMANLTTTVLSLNISGIQAAGSLAMLRSLLHREHVDIALLQEVSVPSFDFFGYDEYVNVGAGRRGTAILYKENIPLKGFTALPCGRGISAQFGRYTIINVYAPSGSNNRQERNMFFGAEVLPLFQRTVDNIVLAGDFNCVLRAEDTLGHANICGQLRALTQRLHLVDPSVHINRPIVHTYRTATMASGLDRFYVSYCNILHVKSMHEHIVPFGDHLAVACHINLSEAYTPRGPSYWKCDTTAIQDIKFLPAFKERWAQLLPHQKRYADIADWWDKYAKPSIQRFCRQFTSNMYRERNTLQLFYEQCLKDLIAEPPSPDNFQNIRHYKQLLVQLTQKKLQCVIVRSKVPEVAEEEIATMYHAINRHRRARSRAVHSMVIGGETLKDNPSILNHAREHMASQFACPIGPSIAPQYLEDTPRILDREQAEALGQEITAEELQRAVFASARRKSPGPDGLPPEFYMVVFNVIKDELLAVVKCVLNRGALCETQTQGIMVLVPKTQYARNITEYPPHNVERGL